MSTFAVADLHGFLELYEQIKAFLKPEDKVYCLGDCGDRGPDPWETIKAVRQDPQFIYLKGNHEDMLVKAANSVISGDDWFGGQAQYQLAINGGSATLDGLLGEERPELWVKELRDLPLVEKYVNKNGIQIILNHAGMTWNGTLPPIEDLLWDREHFFDSWNTEEYNNTICVHGHTNIWYVCNQIQIQNPHQLKPGALWYCDDHKVCIDNGTYASGHICLLNLDTFDEHIFSIEMPVED